MVFTILVIEGHQKGDTMGVVLLSIGVHYPGIIRGYSTPKNGIARTLIATAARTSASSQVHFSVGRVGPGQTAVLDPSRQIWASRINAHILYMYTWHLHIMNITLRLWSLEYKSMNIIFMKAKLQ